MLAIVLNRRDIREHDQMVTLYTRDLGKREVLARGIKKATSKNAAALLPFFLVEAEIVPGKDVNHLTKVYIAESFPALATDFTKMKLVLLSLDHLNALLHAEEHDHKIFNGLVEWLRFLNTEPVVHPAMLDAFFIKMFAYLGLKIELDRCVSCGKKEGVALDVKNGGVVCRDCTLKRQPGDHPLLVVTSAEINLIKLLLVKKLAEIQALVAQTALGQVHAVIYAFIVFHGHKPLPDWAKAF